MRLAKMPWNAVKIRKRVTKWTVFFLISFFISNIFLAYLIGTDKLLLYITAGPANNLNTFVSLLIFTGVFYFVFAWFREQVCIIACPYGRLQGVLLDNKSIVVAYDHKRGEGRSGRKKIRKKRWNPRKYSTSEVTKPCAMAAKNVEDTTARTDFSNCSRIWV